MNIGVKIILSGPSERSWTAYCLVSVRILDVV